MLFVALLAFLTGCATRKASTSVEQHTTEQSSFQVNQQQGSRREKTSTASTASELSAAIREQLQGESSENLRVDVTVYDTTRPADSATGRPPVLADATIQRERQHTTRQDRQSDVQTSAQSESEHVAVQSDSLQTHLNATASAQNDTKIDTKTKTTRRVPWWVWGIGVGCVMILSRVIRRKIWS